MDKPRKPKTGSTPMNVDPRTASRMGNLPAGGARNIRQSKIKDAMKNIKNRPFGGGNPTPQGDVEQSGNIVGRKAKKNNGGPPTRGGDVDPETGDLIDHIIHEIAFTRQGRAARAADQVEPSAPIPPKSKVSDEMMNKALKKAMDQYKPKPKPNDQTPPGMNTESGQKAGHPEAYKLGLDKDTTDNKEYQRILRNKRIVRAAMMSNPDHPDHDTDDVSQDDVVAADKAARGRKFNPRNVGKDAY